MMRAYKALAITFVATLGLWGCAKGPAVGNGAADRIKALETRNTKLEDDYRTASAMREQLRKRLQIADEQRAQAEQQLATLQQTIKQRDDLRAQLDARTGERDAAQAQLDQLRKGIKNLLGQVEAAAPAPAPQPVTSAAETPATGKS
jgi:TolA-binding protein